MKNLKVLKFDRVFNGGDISRSVSEIERPDIVSKIDEISFTGTGFVFQKLYFLNTITTMEMKGNSKASC